MKFIKIPNANMLINLDNVATIYFNEEFNDVRGYYICIDLSVSNDCIGTKKVYFKTIEEAKKYFEFLIDSIDGDEKC